MICFRCALASSKTSERVVVALRHLFAVGAGHLGRGVEHFLLRHHEDFAELMVEAAGQVAADFDVLHLVLADGHDVAVVGQDVGRHQHGIARRGRRRPRALWLCDLCRRWQRSSRPIGAPVIRIQQSSLTSGTSDCTKSVALFGSRPSASRSSAMSNVYAAELVAIADRGQRVQIGDEVEGLVVVLQGNVLADGAEVVAPVDRPVGWMPLRTAHMCKEIRGQGCRTATGGRGFMFLAFRQRQRRGSPRLARAPPAARRALP